MELTGSDPIETSTLVSLTDDERVLYNQAKFERKEVERRGTYGG